MLIGIENFGGTPNSQFDTRLSSSSFDYVKIKECVIDEVFASNNEKLEHTTDKREWLVDTVFLGTFNNTFECGNLGNNDQVIDSIRFKKRVQGGTDWIFIEEVPYNKETIDYLVIDRLAYSLDTYEYALCPVTQGVEGDYITAETTAEYEGLWILDRNEGYRFYYNLEYGNITPVVNDIEFELLESEYPVFQSTITNYEKGSNSAVIIGNKTGHSGVNVDYIGDKHVLDKVKKFLNNHKAKILKDGNGVKRIVITKDVTIKPMKSKLGGVPTVEFNWVEVGDANSTEHLILHGLLPEEAGDTIG